MIIESLEIVGAATFGWYFVEKTGLVRSFKSGWRHGKRLAAQDAAPVPTVPLAQDLYSRAIATQDREDRRLFALVPDAFWLHPDRWKGLERTNPKDPGADWFWMRVQEAMKPSVDQALDEILLALDKLDTDPKAKMVNGPPVNAKHAAAIAKAMVPFGGSGVVREYKDQEDYEQNDPEVQAWKSGKLDAYHAAEKARQRRAKLIASAPLHRGSHQLPCGCTGGRFRSSQELGEAMCCECGRSWDHMRGDGSPCKMHDGLPQGKKRLIFDASKELPCGCDFDTKIYVERIKKTMETWTTCLNCNAKWQPASNDSTHRRLAQGEEVHFPDKLIDTGLSVRHGSGI